MGSTPVNISASRGAAVIGLSNFSTPFKVWQKIQEELKPGFNKAKGFKFPDFEESAFTRYGHAFEDSIAFLAGQIYDREGFYSCEKMDFVTCHIDGRYSEKILHEAKTTFQFVFKNKFGEPETDQVPPDYMIQAQHQMLCTRANSVVFSVLVFPKSPDELEKSGREILKINNSYRIKLEDRIIDPFSWSMVLNDIGFFHNFYVDRDEELIKMLQEKYMLFWQKNIMEEIEPDLKDFEDLKRIIPDPCGSIILDPQTESFYHEYKDIQKELSQSGQMAKRKDQLKTIILDRARKIDSIIDDDSKHKIIFFNTRGDKIGTYGKNKNGALYFR
jgi:hypothetical protein